VYLDESKIHGNGPPSKITSLEEPSVTTATSAGSYAYIQTLQHLIKFSEYEKIAAALLKTGCGMKHSAILSHRNQSINHFFIDI